MTRSEEFLKERSLVSLQIWNSLRYLLRSLRLRGEF
jgi:hypothetical protein